MKKEEIYVVIDSEKLYYSSDDYLWMMLYGECGHKTEITLDQLEQLLIGKGKWYLCVKEVEVEQKNKSFVKYEQGVEYFDKSGVDTVFETKYFTEIEKPTELTFPREMMVSNAKGVYPATIIGKVGQFWVDISGDTHTEVSEIEPPKPTPIDEIKEFAKERGFRIRDIEKIDRDEPEFVLPEKWAVKRTDESADYMHTSCENDPSLKQETKFGEWISVEDRLPEYFENFLSVCDGFICIGHLYSTENDTTAISINGSHPIIFSDARFTHWMPLPEKPD